MDEIADAQERRHAARDGGAHRRLELGQLLFEHRQERLRAEHAGALPHLAEGPFQFLGPLAAPDRFRTRHPAFGPQDRRGRLFGDTEEGGERREHREGSTFGLSVALPINRKTAHAGWASSGR